VFESIIANPATWLFLLLFVVAEYWNFQHGKQLDVVCQAVPWADVLPNKPRTDLEKAQLICSNRQDSSPFQDD